MDDNARNLIMFLLWINGTQSLDSMGGNYLAASRVKHLLVLNSPRGVRALKSLWQETDDLSPAITNYRSHWLAPTSKIDSHAILEMACVIYFSCTVMGIGALTLTNIMSSNVKGKHVCSCLVFGAARISLQRGPFWKKSIQSLFQGFKSTAA